jgi:fatty acid desaturase
MFTSFPIQQFRRSPSFYRRYDSAYALVFLALIAARFAVHRDWLLLQPTGYWLLYFPCAVYALIVAHLCMHNACHGSFPRNLNRAIGELLGLLVVVRFASWNIVHMRHHAFSDHPDSDPHPTLADFWATAKHTVINVERQLQRFYFETWGDTETTHALEARRAKISYGTNLLLLVAWLAWIGPAFFLLIFLPANLLAGLFVIHFNWSTHNGMQGRDFRPVNLNRGYFWLGNRIFFGIYMHANHHERPYLFNPGTWDAERLGSAEPCVDVREPTGGIS